MVEDYCRSWFDVWVFYFSSEGITIKVSTDTNRIITSQLEHFISLLSATTNPDGFDINSTHVNQMLVSLQKSLDILPKIITKSLISYEKVLEYIDIYFLCLHCFDLITLELKDDPFVEINYQRKIYVDCLKYWGLYKEVGNTQVVSEMVDEDTSKDQHVPMSLEQSEFDKNQMEVEMEDIFEDTILDVDDFVTKGTVKYVESQVYNVGVSVKKFYYDVQDKLPHVLKNVKEQKPSPIAKQINGNEDQLLREESSTDPLRANESTTNGHHPQQITKLPLTDPSQEKISDLPSGKDDDATTWNEADYGFDDYFIEDSTPESANTNSDKKNVPVINLSPSLEPKRSAHDILSSLRKPTVQGDNIKPMVKEPFQLLVSDIHYDTKNQIAVKVAGAKQIVWAGSLDLERMFRTCTIQRGSGRLDSLYSEKCCLKVDQNRVWDAGGGPCPMEQPRDI